jgi:phage terminase large subunit GpA-like protein
VQGNQEPTAAELAKAEKLFRETVDPLWLPPPEWTVSQWADAERFLSPESAAEPGKWSTDRAPYQRGIMDALSDPFIETVVVMKSAQVGYSEILNNIIGFYIAQDPAPMMMIQPTLDLAESFSKTRIAPMLRDTPALAGKVADARSRDSGNTLLEKSFPGGTLVLAGANSPASLASRPIRVVLFDEVDRYPASAGAEGDPISLGEKRTTTFWNRKKLIGGTPTVKGRSRTELAFEETDKRYFHLPCPGCGHMQPLKWARIHFESARHACEECGVLSTKPQWLRGRGEWRATEANPKNPKAAGFHINELYSPWVRWEQTIANFKLAQGNTELLKAWVNLSLGETWEDEGETVDPNSLMGRREEYPAPVPAGALVLTAGVDVQRDRLEVEVVGWGLGEESWSVERRILWGDPDKAAVWLELDEYRGRTWMHENGHQLRISAVCIDSGGSNTQAVYDYCRGKAAYRVFPIKGKEGEGRPIVSAPLQQKMGRVKRPVKLFTVGVDAAKTLIYDRLTTTKPGPGYCHFSKTVNDEEFFAQLTAEKCVTKYNRGFAKRVWEVVRSNGRNEALDCRVYAYAALKILQPVWPKLQRQLGSTVKQAAPVVVEDEAAVPEVAEDEDAPAPAEAALVEQPRLAPATPSPVVPAAAPPPDAPVEISAHRREPPPKQSNPMLKLRRRSGFVMGWK